MDQLPLFIDDESPSTTQGIGMDFDCFELPENDLTVPTGITFDDIDDVDNIDEMDSESTYPNENINDLTKPGSLGSTDACQTEKKKNYSKNTFKVNTAAAQKRRVLAESVANKLNRKLASASNLDENDKNTRETLELSKQSQQSLVSQQPQQSNQSQESREQTKPNPRPIPQQSYIPQVIHSSDESEISDDYDDYIDDSVEPPLTLFSTKQGNNDKQEQKIKTENASQMLIDDESKMFVLQIPAYVESLFESSASDSSCDNHLQMFLNNSDTTTNSQHPQHQGIIGEMIWNHDGTCKMQIGGHLFNVYKVPVTKKTQVAWLDEEEHKLFIMGSVGDTKLVCTPDISGL